MTDLGAFAHVAFEGESDVGVINLTTSVTTKCGAHICDLAMLSDAERRMNDVAFERASGGVLAALVDR